MMNVKIDTKERFTVLTPQDEIFSATMTDDLAEYGNSDKPHLVVNLMKIKDLDAAAAKKLAELQQSFYEKDRSLIFCEMQKNVQNIFEKEDLMETLNVTPTESEAWDILQMEEIERELLGGFNDEENKDQ